MNKKIISVNGNIYVFYIKNENINVLKYGNKYEKINFNNPNDYSSYSDDIIIGLIEMVKNDILKKINTFKNQEEIKKEFDKKLNKIDGLNIKDIQNHKYYKETLDEINSEYEKQNNNVEEKKEVIEETFEVDIKTIFQTHGITEFEIGKNKSAITYEKNGIPHVITHTNPNTNIYKEILKNIEFDKLHSKEDLDREIDNSFDKEKDRFTNYQTEKTDKINDSIIEEISDYLKKEYNIRRIYDVKPSYDNQIGESLLIDIGNGWQLLTIERDIDGVINSVNLGTQKNIDNEKNTTLSIQSIKTEKIEENITNEAIEKQIKDILLKLYEEQELNIEDKKVIEKYSDDTNFYTLSPEAQEMYLQVSELYNNLQIEINPEKNKEEAKVYKIEKEDEKAFIETILITFLSSLASGALLYMFIKLLV